MKKVDPQILFQVEPIRIIERTSNRYVEALKTLARHAENIYLALDADTEGESISFEVIDIIRKINPYGEFKRLWFNSTVKEELLRALKDPQTPQKLLAEKCFARMKVDLIIGAAYTRLLTIAVQRSDAYALPFGRFLSYGPCQSPTLYLVVERAWQREKFKTKKFYNIKAEIEIYGAIYEAEYIKRKIKEKEAAEKIYNKIKDTKEAIVTKYTKSKRQKNPPKPLATLDLETRASRFLNIRAKRTLDLAEELYRNGYISYPRTETEIYSPKLKLKEKLEMFKKHPNYKEYAAKLLSKKTLKPTRGKRDDKAHPPIHPTRAATKEEITRRINNQAWRLYDLIVRHFMATLDEEAEIETSKAELNINNEKFILKGTLISKLGYLTVYPYEKQNEEYLPKLSKDEKFKVLKIKILEGKTEPPPHLSEAQLLKKMDKYGIGTDATKQDHIHNNIKRGYFYIEKKRCIPTPLGIAIIEALHEITPEVVKPEVRGFMEKMFNQIASGEKTMDEVVNKAREYFLERYIKLKEKEDEIAKKIIPVIRQSIKITSKNRWKKNRWRRKTKA